MQAYSVDLRQRVVAACQSGQTERQVAERFCLSLSSVQRYKRQARESPSLSPKPWPGRAPKIKKEQQEDLRALVATRTDWTLDALSQAWHKAHGVPTIPLSVSVLSDTLKRFQITYKKRVASLPSATRRSAKRSERQ
jgi:transposase